ncbi:MAG: TerC family protein [Bacteroidia bacterium]|jgi:predicted tellurium resistance membrane protein TerC|nr:TerC family protein [Bacteroidia bacterium]
MEFLQDTNWILPLLTLFFMELVLGIDNIIFISILVDKLPEHKRKSTMQLGITLAVGCRIVLLFFIGWLVGLTTPILTIQQFNLTGRDLILFVGGAFLVVKTLIELYHKVYQPKLEQPQTIHNGAVVSRIIIQIIFIDLIFSFDSILTAIGLVESITLMVIAVVGSTIVVVMIAKQISEFINENPSVKILALSFLLLIGGYLISESLHIPFDKSLLYFGMGFAFFNEMLNLQFKKQYHGDNG